MTLLDVSDLSVRYGGVSAVRAINVSVAAGEVSVVLGPNGAGKTSSLRAISGVIPRHSGVTNFAGKDISKWPAHRIARAGLVMIPEGRRIFAPLSVEENLLLGGYSNRSKSRLAQLLDEVYAMFPVLHERRMGSAGYLSGGEQQMLAFGRALMADPRVVLMDEPSMGLSPAMVAFVMASAAQIAERGIGVLMVEQNATAALAVADRGVVLERGEVVLRGTASELSAHPDVVKAFLGEASVSEPTSVSERIRAAEQ